tara:strand:+ start:1305 stop:2093 length:789 start_codon:yes stop_codon:yes gene_type:complete
MQEGIFIAASGALRQQRKLEVLANNLANMNNAGFKKDDLVFESMVPPFRKDSLDVSRNVLLPVEQSNLNVSYAGVAGFSTNFTQGTLDQTNNVFDVALDGEGFFVVDTPDGVRYTRKGNLHLDEQNNLVTQNGFLLQGAQGGNITLPNVTGEITIDTDGNISGGSGVAIVPLGRMKVVTFDDKTGLEKKGDGMFKLIDPSTQEQIPGKTQVRQGYVEQSNVKSVDEMVSLIDTVRSFEAYQKMIQTIDQLDERSANSIGRVG